MQGLSNRCIGCTKLLDGAWQVTLLFNPGSTKQMHFFLLKGRSCNEICRVFCVLLLTSLMIKQKIFKTNIFKMLLRSFSTRVRKNHELIYDFICSNLSTSSHIFFNCNQNRHSSYTVKFINASLTVKTCFESLNACWQKKFNSYKNYLLIPTVFDSDKI